MKEEKKESFANKNNEGGFIKKRKKAFTLIELLAIIVILAIIAVITVPIILNIIENSRKGAATDSAYGYKDSVNKFYIAELQNHNKLKLDGTYTVNSDGSLTPADENTDFNDDEITRLSVSVSGTIPSSGSLTYENNVLTGGCLTIGDYKVTFKTNGSVDKTEKGNCVASVPSVTLKDARQTLITKSQNDETGNEPVAVSHLATVQTSATTDYRYMGVTPNNYIYFNCSNYDKDAQNDTNCEIWRIIGIVDGKIKIIRDDSIGNYAWDNNSSIANYQFYNEWGKATLKTYLNSNYYTNTITSATKNLNLILPSTWYLGAYDFSSITAEQSYQYERGNTVYSCDNDEYYSGNGDDYYCVARSTILPSTDFQEEIYVGLIYPSDYGFASNVCYIGTGIKNLYDYDDSTCKNSNWLYKGGESGYDTEWLLSPNSVDYTSAFTINYDGYVEEMGSRLDQTFKVRPSVYLDSNIELVGTGADTNPYKIIK